MISVLRVVHWLVALGLIAVVILQPGKSAGLGTIGGGAEALLGKRQKGIDAFLAKLTVYLAIGFMLNSIALTMLRR